MRWRRWKEVDKNDVSTVARTQFDERLKKWREINVRVTIEKLGEQKFSGALSL